MKTDVRTNLGFFFIYYKITYELRLIYCKIKLKKKLINILDYDSFYNDLSYEIHSFVVKHTKFDIRISSSWVLRTLTIPMLLLYYHTMLSYKRTLHIYYGNCVLVEFSPNRSNNVSFFRQAIISMGAKAKNQVLLL